MSLRVRYRCWNEFNTATTSPTASYYEPVYYYQPPPKQCGGMSECGSPCHKVINCTIVDQYKKDGETIYKYYCRECEEFGEGKTGGCK
jgi:hypothetical protein